MEKAQREELARKRLLSILGRHGVANARTLEQKISDAGPNNQRIDPHVLTPVRQKLESEGLVQREGKANSTWYYLGNASREIVAGRLDEQVAAFKAFTQTAVTHRTGQALEIATYRALSVGPLDEFYGRFSDLDLHDDSRLYSKEEPPQHIGRSSLQGKQRLDFIIRHPSAGYLGLECKNIREWLYPDRDEIYETLQKCLQLNTVPVIIARRIPFVTFKLMNACGVIVHQTYNQLMAEADAAIAATVSHKDSLGYHDIRTGNVPDARMLKFITKDLPAISDEARVKFDDNRDLLGAFAFKKIDYTEFAARLRRRSNGANEDHDWDDL